MRFYLILFLNILSSIVFSQIEKTNELYKTIERLDSLIFDEGFNNCNFSNYNQIISDDLEFYHDIGGITSGKQDFLNSMKNNICGGIEKVKREKTLNTMNVFPLYDQNEVYGAIQEGNHDFYRWENEGWLKVGTAKYSILWLLEGKIWKMKRVFSFNHKGLN